MVLTHTSPCPPPGAGVGLPAAAVAGAGEGDAAFSAGEAVAAAFWDRRCFFAGDGDSAGAGD